MLDARRAPSKHEDELRSWIKVTVTARKPVSFRVGWLRKLHKTKNVAEWRYGRRYPYRWTKIIFFVKLK